MKFRFCQLTPAGLWVSHGIFEEDYEDIVAQVERGHVRGQPRAAVEVGSGDVLCALDAEGRRASAEDWRASIRGAKPYEKRDAA